MVLLNLSHNTLCILITEWLKNTVWNHKIMLEIGHVKDALTTTILSEISAICATWATLRATECFTLKPSKEWSCPNNSNICNISKTIKSLSINQCTKINSKWCIKTKIRWCISNKCPLCNPSNTTINSNNIPTWCSNKQVHKCSLLLPCKCNKIEIYTTLL